MLLRSISSLSSGSAAVDPTEQTITEAAPQLTTDDGADVYYVDADSPGQAMTLADVSSSKGRLICIVGTDDTNYPTLTASAENVDLMGGADLNLYANTSVLLLWSGSVWMEVTSLITSP